MQTCINSRTFTHIHSLSLSCTYFLDPAMCCINSLKHTHPYVSTSVQRTHSFWMKNKVWPLLRRERKSFYLFCPVVRRAACCLLQPLQLHRSLFSPQLSSSSPWRSCFAPGLLSVLLPPTFCLNFNSLLHSVFCIFKVIVPSFVFSQDTWSHGTPILKSSPQV